MKTPLVLILLIVGCLPIPPVGIQLVNAQSFHSAKAPQPAAGTMFVFPERIKLQNGDLVTATRGWYFAPLNRSTKGGDVVAIEFYQFPRSAKAKPDTPPIFVLNGGPGFPGLAPRLAKPGFYERQVKPQTDIADVVVVGQRGIGSSKPDTVIDQMTGRIDIERPYEDQDVAGELRRVLSRERQFWLDQGVDLTGFNVLECAADVNEIAQGLGYRKITLFGSSFGSHWAMAIIRNYPERVARAVLSGLEGPNHTWDHPGWIWNTYQRVAADAEDAEGLQANLPAGGLTAAVERLADRVNQAPISVVLNADTPNEKTIVIDRFQLGRILRNPPGGMRGWPKMVIELDRGELEGAARRALMMSFATGPRYSTASYWVLDSGSGITANRRREYEADPALRIVGNTFWSYAVGSPVWRFDLGDRFRSDFSTEVPALLVHGTWDTSTPYENALELKSSFPRGHLVTVKRGSHGALGEAMQHAPKFTQRMTQFLIDGSLDGMVDEVELPEPDWARPSSPESASD